MEQQFDRRPDEETNSEGKKSFRSDADRIIHRHLMDKNDVITDEDLKNIRVGSGPVEMDDATLARFEDNDRVDDIERRIESEPNEDQGPNGKASGANPITPWDLEKD